MESQGAEAKQTVTAHSSARRGRTETHKKYSGRGLCCREDTLSLSVVRRRYSLSISRDDIAIREMEPGNGGHFVIECDADRANR